MHEQLLIIRKPGQPGLLLLLLRLALPVLLATPSTPTTPRLFLHSYDPKILQLVPRVQDPGLRSKGDEHKDSRQAGLASRFSGYPDPGFPSFLGGFFFLGE